MKAAALGRIPVLNSSDVQKQIASKLPWTKGKNLSSLFKSKPAERAMMHTYDPLVLNEIREAFNEVFSGNTDINTALRTAEERANANILKEQSKK
jgi:multiple sugar transport system substrate-binding protein